MSIKNYYLHSKVPLPIQLLGRNYAFIISSVDLLLSMPEIQERSDI